VPVFEYRCAACEEREEHVLLVGEEPPVACKACGGELKRMWSARIQINLVGWGFSKNDALIADTRGKDFKELRERAQRMVEE
jgi:putative FmdB family regulatory protein